MLDVYLCRRFDGRPVRMGSALCAPKPRRVGEACHRDTHRPQVWQNQLAQNLSRGRARAVHSGRHWAAMAEAEGSFEPEPLPEEPELISQLEGIVRKLDVLEQERKGIPYVVVRPRLFVCDG